MVAPSQKGCQGPHQRAEGNAFLLAAIEIAQSYLACRQFVIADQHGMARIQFVGSLHALFHVAGKTLFDQAA